MPIKATAGLKPCATTEELYENTNHGCRLCEASADGYDATFDGPLCRTCATAFSDFYENTVEGQNE